MPREVLGHGSKIMGLVAKKSKWHKFDRKFGPRKKILQKCGIFHQGGGSQKKCGFCAVFAFFEFRIMSSFCMCFWGGVVKKFPSENCESKRGNTHTPTPKHTCTCTHEFSSLGITGVGAFELLPAHFCSARTWHPQVISAHPPNGISCIRRLPEGNNGLDGS